MEGKDSLSILQMSLDNPAILEECICSLVISQVYALSGIANDVSRSRISSRTIPYKLLQV